LTKAFESWRRLNDGDLSALNRKLALHKLPPLAGETVPDAPSCTP
jgi:hypothetical protein